MLDSLYIKNFRLFKELQVERLGRVNLIVGKNNSGKNCLLEALWIYAANAEPVVLKEILSNRDEYEIEVQLARSNAHYIQPEKHPCRHLFYDYRLPNPEAEGIEIGPVEPEQNRLKLVVRHGDNDTGLELTRKNEPSALFPLDKPLSPEYIRASSVKEKFNIQFVSTGQLDAQKMEDLWNNIVLISEEPIIRGLRLIDIKIQKVGLIRNSYPGKNGDTIYTVIPVAVRENSTERLPLKNCGEGISRIFHIILALLNARDGFLLIDELENGLHYTVQVKIWSLIFTLAREFNVQVFATTHSRDCVAAFQKASQDSEEEAMLFRLARSARAKNRGQVIASVYDKQRLQLAAQEELDVR